jgi:Tol biopolymer transport system component/polyisoprenoid-binding protein YceI
MRFPWPHTWKTRILVLVPVAAVVLFGAAYTVFALQTAGAPPPAQLPPASPRTTTTSTGGIDGRWTLVADGASFVGYRIRERLGIFPAPNDAVGRTPGVQGGVTIADGAITAARFVADLQRLTSDQPIRDRIMADQGLQILTYPQARFVLTRPVTIGSPVVGQVVSFTAIGELTLHGVTRSVTFTAQGRWDGDVIHIAAHSGIERPDFRLTLEGQYGLHVADQGTIEAELTFVRAGVPGPTPTIQPVPSLSTGPPPATRPTERLASGSAVLALAITQEDSKSIFVVREDGTGLRRLTPASAFGDDQPSWSPDGTTIAFTRGEDRDPFPPIIRVFLMRSDGSGVHALTRGEVEDAAPSFSPDGSKIAFVRVRDIYATNAFSEIWVVNADGTGLRRLTHDGSTVKDTPAWSPDGRWIAYEAFGGGAGNEDIWVMRADGTGAHAITSDPAYEYSPAWSPDGARIAFAKDGDVWVMRPDGSGARRLTTGPGRDGQVTWSRDNHIVFVRDDRVIIMNSGGSHQRRVELGHRPATFPSLRP